MRDGEPWALAHPQSLLPLNSEQHQGLRLRGWICSRAEEWKISHRSCWAGSSSWAQLQSTRDCPPPLPQHTFPPPLGALEGEAHVGSLDARDVPTCSWSLCSLPHLHPLPGTVSSKVEHEKQEEGYDQAPPHPHPPPGVR